MGKVVSIAGSSGVGKTTMARVVFTILGCDKTIILNDDDLHKWERNDENWYSFTHLNPNANRLAEGTQDVKLLKSGEKIFRKTYNHDTGRFDNKKKKVNPKKNIIREGLLTFYRDEDVAISDIKIFIEAEENLKNKWKIERDIKKRGYDLSNVISVINRRKKDEKDYVMKQKNNSDIIFRFIEDNNEIKIICVFCKEKYNPFVEDVLSFYETQKEFVKTCNILSENNSLVQEKGGNVSHKFKNGIVITASGTDLKDVSFTDNFTYCNQKGKKIFKKQKRPSMELQCHLNINEKVVIHTHPVYVLCAMCCEDSEKILKHVFNDIDYEIIEYSTPGDGLARSLKNKNSKKTYFLKNHGLITSGDSFQKCLKDTIEINSRLKDYFNQGIKPVYLFPDAVILKESNHMLNSFVKFIIESAGHTLREISEKEVRNLLSMESEKYRQRDQKK